MVPEIIFISKSMNYFFYNLAAEMFVYDDKVTINQNKKNFSRLFWSSHQRCSIKKVLLKNFAKFTGKDLCQSLIFNEVAALTPGILLKKDSNTGVWLLLLVIIHLTLVTDQCLKEKKNPVSSFLEYLYTSLRPCTHGQKNYSEKYWRFLPLFQT